MLPSIAFVWDNFGPLHHDRLRAMVAGGWHVTGVEIASRSSTYAWQAETAETFKHITLFPDNVTENMSHVRRFWALVRTAWQLDCPVWFLCHYEQPFIFLTALVLRVMGKQVFVMNDSKWDDYPRSLPKEILKAFMYLPYHGALVGSPRTADYLHMLGFYKRPCVGGYNTMDTLRIQTLAGVLPAPKGTAFAKRHFTVVARLVEKKNLFMAVKAYALYAATTSNPRPLHIYGNGPLEGALRAHIAKYKQTSNIHLHGFVQTQGIAQALGTSLALILPSLEEQFGNVVIEAQAMGLPVLATYLCGAADELIRDGLNGFTFRPDNPEALAFFMTELANRKDLWERLSQGTRQTLPLGDATRFATGIKKLLAV